MPGPLIVSVAGKKLLPKEKELLSHPKVGGVVLFRENFDKEADEKEAIEGLKLLVKEIRACNPDLLIMVDHEGGKVWRFEKGFTKLPPAKELGELYDKDKAGALKLAYERGAVMAEELLACDIDMSLAPVVDSDDEDSDEECTVIGKLLRAFHHDPKIRAEIAAEFVRGMNDKGMPATLKHFPDHGHCGDSHTTKPVDNRSMEELRKIVDLVYKFLIEKGLNVAVMPAHVTYPKVDPKNTAGFSKIWLQDYLRTGCGFIGVIISDCLLMKGADVGTVLERIQAAQDAGCDFSMYTHQHGDDLDKLLGILDKIPDSKEGVERRKVLAQSVKKKADPLKPLPQSSPKPLSVLAQASSSEVPINILQEQVVLEEQFKEQKQISEKQLVSGIKENAVLAGIPRYVGEEQPGSIGHGIREKYRPSKHSGEVERELGKKETIGVMLPQFSSVLAQTSALRPYSVVDIESEPGSSRKGQELELDEEGQAKKRQKTQIS